MIKSLHVLNHPFAIPKLQIEVLAGTAKGGIPAFAETLAKHDQLPLRSDRLAVLQVNIGKMCNQTCKHCHVDAGPDRREVMDKLTMEHCLNLIRRFKIPTVDITGGAPEMNPNFRWFVAELRSLGVKVIVRCNLTIILANRKFLDLPEFFRANQVEIVSSLPSYTSDRTDRQRGEGVFERSIRALRMLNEAGYGIAGSGLVLNLVYNPAGAFMPPDQGSLEKEYKAELLKTYEIQFNSLFVITNMPVSRYLDYLVSTGNYDRYMMKLYDSFNPGSVSSLMCKTTLSVSWDGYLFDCDFNQMLELYAAGRPIHVSSPEVETLVSRTIVLGPHCYGCTAGAGSSCGGSLDNAR